MYPTQADVPKPPLGPLFGSDEAANLSLLFDPEARAAQEPGPDRPAGGHAASGNDIKAPLRFLAGLRPVRAGGLF